MSTDTNTAWKETTLGKVGGIQTGPFGSQLHESDYVNVGTPIITVEHLLNDRISHDEDIPKVSTGDTQRLKGRYGLVEGDIVFSRVGSVDRSAYVSKNEEGWLFSGRLLRVRPDKEIVSSKWLDYWLRQEEIKAFVRRVAVGATMPSINTSLLGDVPVLLPPMKQQEDIAAIFSALDNKTELLQRQNNTLEQIAQAIFNEKFVKPTANEVLPAGWKMGAVSDVLSLEYGKSLTEGNRKGGDYPVIGSSGIVGYHDDFLVADKGIVIGRKGIVGSIMWIGSSFFPIDTTFYVKDKLGVDNLYYHYYLLRSLGLENAGSHSAVPGLSRDTVYAISTPIPPKEAISDFGSFIETLYNRKTRNKQQTDTLSKMRDALLPKLMSGELTIS